MNAESAVPAKTRQSFRLNSRACVLVLSLATVALLLLSLDYLFNTKVLAFLTSVQHQFFYSILLFSLPVTFLVWPLRGYAGSRLDLLVDSSLALVAAGVCLFFVWNGETIIYQGWEYMAPDHAVYVSFLLWGLLLEALRRVAGLSITLIAGVVSVYPLWADVMPGPIQGVASSSGETAAFHAMSLESILGIPFQAFANLVVGFMIFGVALQKTGGGKFFIDFAFALLGHVRGGPAKVAVLSSGMMGSLSGSVITNVVTTGSLTIPAMKSAGFSPRYAGGIEACASTGGTMMPPVMGATAFVMASFLNVSYSVIVLAAIVPSVLYFLGLFLQVDGYAARSGIKGLRKEDLPSLRRTLKEGWYYLFAFGTLVWMLFFLGREAHAPYYASVVVIALNQILPYSRWRWAQLVDFVVSLGKTIIELTIILASVGLLVGAMTVTGLAGTIANDLMFIAGNNAYVLLLMGAVISFILGIGMTATSAYIFLAVALAPALVNGAGMNPIAVHLFIMYWGMLSFITPPVALGAFAAASIAGARPMETGLAALRLGAVIYVIPFLFVLNPALILQGEPPAVALAVGKAVVGVVFISAAIQGYLLGLGDLTGRGAVGMASRIALAVGGLVIAMPAEAIQAAVSAPYLALLVGSVLLFVASQGYLRRGLLR
ncbi:TRAP transporter permease [Alkalilimnicola sp. S0819]|uniref:TRAP transporter permease n=1 Tax=Alkalilimnicola sp. S0819 TaxID=2613922 RepID=UPI0012623082|nr:TRAP transporter fused permease subunit [Alkalilimnicola sp. S0819]KAB7624078.1 TRAP transporter fused permease subunit [Alkalilimnicola sp. S0819]MPQ16328.1 TRAP transporter fused permease subunit [Alkalilimnicola sp. S0819]